MFCRPTSLRWHSGYLEIDYAHMSKHTKQQLLPDFNTMRDITALHVPPVAK
tara:strand:+ start:366 stop:518 length:153 start_codon:yes stop_codon:yes gene_type:complete